MPPGMIPLLLLAFAQPPVKPVPTPVSPTKPDGIPAAEDVYPTGDPTIRLPLPEQMLKVGLRSFAVRPTGGGYVLYAGTVPVREFGADRVTADDALRAVQGLEALTDWGTTGGRAPFDYALAYGRAAPAPHGRHVGARFIDLKSIRAEGVRGAWLVRDDFGLLANCGSDTALAEQAVAVCKRYGFNRLLTIGRGDPPAQRLLFAAPVTTQPEATVDPFATALQNQSLTRTGIPVPGGGYVGERVVIDPRKVEARRERADWVLIHGREVLARFGGDDNGAREAARMVSELRLTEWCTVGGLTFFLSNGQPPSRVPFATRSLPFEPSLLQAVPLDGRWAVAAGGRVLFPAASEAEAKQAIGVIQAFRFDTFCQVGANPRAGLRFLVRTSGR